MKALLIALLLVVGMALGVLLTIAVRPQPAAAENTGYEVDFIKSGQQRLPAGWTPYAVMKGGDGSTYIAVYR